jgi:putative ABC transport system permease protein
MTGQILAGVSPLTAIKYQIIIMLAITGSVALTTLLSLSYGSKTYFNKNAQLVLGDKKNEVGK